MPISRYTPKNPKTPKPRICDQFMIYSIRYIKKIKMQGVETDYTIKNLVFMYKGASVCKNEAADFKLCRATPAGKYGDATLCEPKAASFL